MPCKLATCNLERDLGKEKRALEVLECVACLVALFGACSCGECALGKGAKPSQYQKKADFPQKPGAGSLYPPGDGCDSSWACSLLHGPHAVLASAPAEPLPPFLAPKPATRWFFSEPKAHKRRFVLSDITLLLGASGVSGLGRSQVNPYPPQGPIWEGSPHCQDLGFKIQPGVYLLQCG